MSSKIGIEDGLSSVTQYTLIHNQPNPQIYVLGFAFTAPVNGVHPAVVVIEKKKPAWQAGKLNGIGGKVEPGENPHDAMCREFCEETGVCHMRHTDWHLFEIMRFQNGAVIYCFTSKLPNGAEPRTMESEDVLILPVSPRTGQIITTKPMINNLHWLIPMAYHQMMEPKEERMVVRI